jgi:undecaprenyl-diphosphatase
MTSGPQAPDAAGTGAAVPDDEELPPGLAVRARQALGAMAVLLGLAVAALSYAVAQDPPGRWEASVVRDAAGVWDVVGVPARAVMQLGTAGGVASIALVTGWIAARTEAERPRPSPASARSRWRRALAGPRLPAVAVLAGGLLSLLVCNRTKALVERPRPVGVRLREPQDGFGYPSSHAATAFGAAVVLTFLLPRRWRWAPLTVAAIVGLTRMHVGVHYPLDVIGGALIGLAVGSAVVAVLDPSRR